MAFHDKLDDDEFRLLVLWPGTGGEPLYCELEKTTLGNHPPYEAISYAWGDSATSVDLQIDGQSLATTQSVETILRRLRLPSEFRTVWIDQLCINQSNTAEKSAQVQIMRDIYTKCDRCLAWLGEVTEHIELHDAQGAVDLLGYLSALDPAELGPVPIPPPSCMESSRSLETALQAIDTISPRFCQWWQRAWTIQESRLPQHVAFLWGPLSFSRDAICSAVEGMDHLADNWEDLGLDEDVADTFWSPSELGHLIARTIWLTKPPEDVYDCPHAAVIKWWNRKASNPLDNVYALTGMYSREQLPRSSRCDYSLDVATVFIDFTLDLICTGTNRPSLFPLLLNHRRMEEEPWRLPRWAIDMRSGPDDDRALWRLYHAYDHESFEANKGLPDVGEPAFKNGSLQLSGVSVDTIRAVAPDTVHSVGDTTSSYLRAVLQSWWESYRDVKCKHQPPNPHDCKICRNFCQLLLGDWHAHADGEPERETTDQDRDGAALYLETGIDEDDLEERISEQIMDRRFFVTKRGLLGLGHSETLPGDEVWIFNHGRVPFTIRPLDDERGFVETRGNNYDFMGHCYAQGIMQGLESGIDGHAVQLEQRVVYLY